MFVGRLPNGKIVAGYRTAEETINRNSCVACHYYVDGDTCKMYQECRAELGHKEVPRLLRLVSKITIESRMKEIDLDG